MKGMVDESGERIHDCRKQTKGKIEAIEKTSCETSGNKRAVMGAGISNSWRKNWAGCLGGKLIISVNKKRETGGK